MHRINQRYIIVTRHTTSCVEKECSKYVLQWQFVYCTHTGWLQFSSSHSFKRLWGFFCMWHFDLWAKDTVHKDARPFILKGQVTGFVSRIWFLHVWICQSLPLASASRNSGSELLWWKTHPALRSGALEQFKVLASLVFKEGKSQLAHKKL